MTGIPKVIRVKPTDDKKLIVNFDNDIEKIYDCTPLLNLPGFRSLNTPAGFAEARVDVGGYAVIWNDTADVSEYELWQKGTKIN